MAEPAVDALRAALVRAGTAQAVLDATVAVLSVSFPLVRASVRALTVGCSELAIVAVWSARPTSLDVGVRMPARATSYAGVLETGAPELHEEVNEEDGLLDQIVSSEGIRSYVTLALCRGDAVVGLLSLSSATRSAFVADDLPLLEQVAELVGARLAVLGVPEA